jgi:O-succinylbenzoate synthase
MNISSVVLHRLRMELVTPFATSYGTYHDRETIIVQIIDEQGVSGWGECVAFETPWYTEETVQGAWHMMEQFLIPSLLQGQIDHPQQLSSLWQGIRRNTMAKAGLEMALWDLYAKGQNKPLYEVVGGDSKPLKVGVAIGLQANLSHYYRFIDQYMQQGYERIKVKIKPGSDIDLIAALRNRYPTIALMADANSAYALSDMQHLQQLDAYNLLMIEQPLAADDIIDHAQLQAQLATPICLDESIVSYDDVRHAIGLGSCRVINIKLGRVGGWNEALRIHQLCLEQHIPLWCGGMLETGIGRAHNLALASLPGFTLPGDISASARYWERDIILPEVVIEQGKVNLPEGAGIGFEVDYDYMDNLTHGKLSMSK